MKFKSKSLISIILSIMMVISMILVAIPANAAVVDSEPVGAGTYYLWYTIGDNTNYSSFTKKVEMTADGSNYVASFEDSSLYPNTTIVCYINTDSSTITTGLNTLKTSTKGTYDDTYFHWLNVGGNYQQSGYYYIKSQVKSSFKVKITYNPTGDTIDLSKDDGSTPTEPTTEPTTTEPTTTEPVETTVPPTTAPVTTPGEYTITDATTDLNGSLSFSASGGTAAGTANSGDTVTITGNPVKTYFELDTVTVTGEDKNNIEVSGTSNTRTFTMPEQNVTVKATFKLNKPAYIQSLKEDGLWIDVAPDEYDTTATLIKWNNYKGSNQERNNPYTFYVPKNVDLSNAHIYNGFNSAVKLNGTEIPSKNTAVVKLTAGSTYSSENDNSYTVKVMQGSTNAMFLYTTKAGVASPLPTKKGAGASKGDVVRDGGVCKTMTNETAKASFSSAMALESVKGRGNSSWQASNEFFGKYAFNMKLAKKTNLFNIDTTKLPDGSKASGSKSYCLLANNADESMLRNALTYQLASEIGLLYSPEFSFVDIYDNGEYLGQYLVTEKVDIGSSKLIKGNSFEDINEDAVKEVTKNPEATIDKTTTKTTYSYTYANNKTYTPDMRYANVAPNGATSDKNKYPYDNTETRPAKQGKYLLEFEISDRVNDEPCYFVSPQGQNVVIKSPEYATKEQVEFIANKFAKMEEVAFTANASKTDLSAVMDVESFAKMYLIQEFTANLDAASTSYYITFDCSQTNPVFVANPVWDYDMALGQFEKENYKYTKDGKTLSPAKTDAWLAKYKRMDNSESKAPDKYSIQSQLASQNSAFKTEIRNQWEGTNGFYANIQKYIGDNGLIKKTWFDNINASAEMNEARWGFIANDLLNKANWGVKNTGANHNEAVNYLNTWTATRATWLNTQFTSDEYPVYTPSAPTIKAYAADGTTEISAVEAGSPFIIKVTSDLESGVVYRLYKDGVKVGTDRSDGNFDIATDESMVGSKYTYTVKAVYGGRESSASTGVEITINEKAGNKTVRVYFKSAAASAYVPSFSLDNAAATVMSRTPKTSTDNGTYFGSTYSGSLKFYWFFKDITIDTSVPHTITFTTKNNVNATTSYTFGAATEYYFAVDNLMGDTTLKDLTEMDEYIRNYHISATHMVYSATSDRNIGFTWAKDTEGKYKEYAMGTYLPDNNISTASLTDLTSSSLLTIPSALTPNAMLEASSAPSFFTIKSATLAQKITAEAEEVSTLQYQLLDVNLDGKVDIKDSTMMQKALAGF
ncbi:MAG TPA: hypothetical protein DE313_04560 [Ruminococcus sp.]|nr:hypothetical protein [Ruminococcus sp.]